MGKRSVMSAKMAAYRKRTYPNPRQAAAYEPCECDARAAIPMWMVDEIEERKLSGGFDTSRKNQCDTCFQVRSSNGTCGCP